MAISVDANNDNAATGLEFIEAATGNVLKERNHKDTSVVVAKGIPPQQPILKVTRDVVMNGNKPHRQPNHKHATSNGHSPMSNGNAQQKPNLKNVTSNGHAPQQRNQNGNHVASNGKAPLSPKKKASAKEKVQEPRKYKGNIVAPEWENELTYEKVLCAARASSSQTDESVPASTSYSSVHRSDLKRSRKSRIGSDNLKYAPWKRVLSFVGKDNLAQSDNNKAVFNLHDDGVAGILEILMERFGRGTHSSFLDDSYSIYLQDSAAVCFKVSSGVAVMYGDPLCVTDRTGLIFDAFRKFCSRQGWSVCVVGAGPVLCAFAKEQNWRTMEFAQEQVFNPVTNGIVDGSKGKTMNRVNRRIVESGINLALYEPSKGIRPQLEEDLLEVYNTWREDKKRRNAPAAYSAVINPFAIPGVTRYLYTTGTDGKPNSLAGLIRLGGTKGYLLEPCIANPGTIKGLTDFLVTHAMALLKDEGCQYFTFGVEALPELGEVTRFPSLIMENSRPVYRMIYNALGMDGRKVFHDKFHPVDEHRVPLYLLFPPGFFSPSHLQAVMTVSNISVLEVWTRSQAVGKEGRSPIVELFGSVRFPWDSSTLVHRAPQLV